jgi:hypothetical protein
MKKVSYLFLQLASTIALAFVITAFSAQAEIVPHTLRVSDERVYANLPMTSLDELLQQICDAGGIDLKVTGNFDAEIELYANGIPLRRLLDRIIPQGAGFALESDAQGRTKRLLVFSDEVSSTRSVATNERQQYLARQIGKRDDGTADLMHATLSDRKLADTPSKLTAIEHLADINSDRAMENLLAGMGDADPQVRLATAEALYRIQGEEAITLIGQIYYDEGSTAIRREVAALVVKSTHPLAKELVRDSGLAQSTLVNTH